MHAEETHVCCGVHTSFAPQSASSTQATHFPAPSQTPPSSSHCAPAGALEPAGAPRLQPSMMHGFPPPAGTSAESSTTMLSPPAQMFFLQSPSFCVGASEPLA